MRKPFALTVMFVSSFALAFDVGSDWSPGVAAVSFAVMATLVYERCGWRKGVI